MDMQQKQLHFVLLPFMAQGHMIPTVDIARLLGKRGLIVTILVTQKNYSRFKTCRSWSPEGCENFDMLYSIDDISKFFIATSMLEEQVETILQKLEPYPSCLISDMCYPWTTNVAVRLGIPRLVFHGISCFSMLCMHMLIASKCFEDIIASDTEYFVVPGLPGRIEITKAQIRGTSDQLPPALAKIRVQMIDADVEAFGTVANTFEELEPEYVKQYMKVKGKKVWCIGPVSLCNEDESDKAERGDKASIDEHECLKWLDLQKSKSVIYACLGSVSSLAASQLVELGLGLEASDRPFIWVVRNASDEFKKWLDEERFEERVRKRGLLIHGWAPQVLILSHPSVGGFLTHCGWNSTLEGITAGLPMVTWPVFAEQFCNEKFVVNVIKTGIRVGVEVPVMAGEEENVGVQVKSDEIKTVIGKLMDGGEEGEERIERARKLREMAKSAPGEGGSSYLSLTQLVRDVVATKARFGCQSGNGEKLES
ncbi:hypothetical protein CASFOL_013445 [Castilleja foliolosa]|uniref:Glycosyltransferase n=1 Tax=Castilleja foliolosa TaxID=1961234 RepID=A0ABD3DJZ8_9LAMI